MTYYKLLLAAVCLFWQATAMENEKNNQIENQPEKISIENSLSFFEKLSLKKDDKKQAEQAVPNMIWGYIFGFLKENDRSSVAKSCKKFKKSLDLLYCIKKYPLLELTFQECPQSSRFRYHFNQRVEANLDVLALAKRENRVVPEFKFIFDDSTFCGKFFNNTINIYNNSYIDFNFSNLCQRKIEEEFMSGEKELAKIYLYLLNSENKGKLESKNLSDRFINCIKLFENPEQISINDIDIKNTDLKTLNQLDKFYDELFEYGFTINNKDCGWMMDVCAELKERDRKVFQELLKENKTSWVKNSAYNTEQNLKQRLFIKEKWSISSNKINKRIYKALELDILSLMELRNLLTDICLKYKMCRIIHKRILEKKDVLLQDYEAAYSFYNKKAVYKLTKIPENEHAVIFCIKKMKEIFERKMEYIDKKNIIFGEQYIEIIKNINLIKRFAKKDCFNNVVTICNDLLEMVNLYYLSEVSTQSN